MNTPKNKSFFSRFNKIISLAYGSVTISAIVLFSFLYNENHESTINTINLRLVEQTQAFNNVLRVRYDAVKALQRQARQFLQREFSMFDTKVDIKDIPSKGIFYLTSRKGDENTYGLLIGTGNTRFIDKAKWLEIHMVFSLMPLINVLKKSIQNTTTFHYTSTNNFYFSYPWREYQEIAFDLSIYQKEYYLRSIPIHNREDKVFWTDVFIDPLGKEMLVTCGAPVYKGFEHVGVIGVDFTLEPVDFFLENLHYKFGEFLVVNDQDTVIADLIQRESSPIKITKIKELLPKNLPYSYLYQVNQGTLTRLGNYWIYIAPTAFAPWKIIYYVHNREITFIILKHILPSILLVMLFTTLFLIGANRLIAQEFITPTSQLVEHINNRGDSSIPVTSLPDPWKNWFDAISKVFKENKALVSKLERHIDKLDEKVAQRTKDLSRKNKQLEATLEKLQKAQSQIITQEKLAGLGSLTAGIAHEIRNPLNFIINFAETSKIFGQEINETLKTLDSSVDEATYENLTELSQQLVKNMDKIEEHGRRADAIVHSMLIHAYGGKDQLQQVHLHDLLNENILLGLASFKQKGFNPKVRKHYDPTLDIVKVYPQDFGRVFLNMINNACYVLHEKAKSHPQDYRPQLTITTHNGPQEFMVKIRDNGTGIPRHIKKKIFDPFFTTKPTGEGTGLGLSLGFDIIVNQHQGKLDLDSEEEKYTEFTITIPKNLSDVHDNDLSVST